MLEEGKANSLREIAEKEKIDNSHVSRIVNLTFLPPDVVAAILDDQLSKGMSLLDLAAWEDQMRRMGLPTTEDAPAPV